MYWQGAGRGGKGEHAGKSAGEDANVFGGGEDGQREQEEELTEPCGPWVCIWILLLVQWGATGVF